MAAEKRLFRYKKKLILFFWFFCNIAQGAAGTFFYLSDDLRGFRFTEVDPWLPFYIEYLAKAFHTNGGMNAKAGFPDNGYFSVAVAVCF